MDNQQLQDTEQRAVAVAKGPRNISDLLKSDDFKAAVKMALPRHLTAERFIRVAINATMRTPKLLQCTKESLFRCLLDLSSYGLEADGRRAHLIPFGQDCQLIIDYKGMVEIVRRSGDVSYIHADVVYDGDEFEFGYGSGAKLVHRPNLARRGDGAQKRLAFYSYVKLRDGSEDFMIMSPLEVESVRRRSRAANSGPWVTDYDEMGKKTVFRRHCKWLPMSAEVRDAIERDDDFAGVDVLQIAGEIEAPKPSPINISTVTAATMQERPDNLGKHEPPKATRTCRTCGAEGHDGRNCPQKNAPLAVSQAMNRSQVREVESLEQEDPMGFAPALKCGGKYYMPNQDKSAWKEVPQQLAEEAVQ
jgi:recombination protein RecT